MFSKSSARAVFSSDLTSRVMSVFKENFCLQVHNIHLITAVSATPGWWINLAWGCGPSCGGLWWPWVFANSWPLHYNITVKITFNENKLRAMSQSLRCLKGLLNWNFSSACVAYSIALQAPKQFIFMTEHVFSQEIWWFTKSGFTFGLNYFLTQRSRTKMGLRIHGAKIVLNI